jgi:hypothetical protein
MHVESPSRVRRKLIPHSQYYSLWQTFALIHNFGYLLIMSTCWCDCGGGLDGCTVRMYLSLSITFTRPWSLLLIKFISLQAQELDTGPSPLEIASAVRCYFAVPVIEFLKCRPTVRPIESRTIFLGDI